MSSRPGVRGFGVAVICVAFSCEHHDPRVKRIGELLDPVGKQLDDFGTVSVSSPLFAEPNGAHKDTFKFELSTGPNDYYNSARSEVQGGAATSFQQASESRIGIEA